MKGVFVRIERDEMKQVVTEMLEAHASVVEISSDTSRFKKIRKSKIKLESDFLMAAEELDLEVEKIKSLMPAVEITGKGRFEFKPGKPILKIRSSRERKTKQEIELEAIRQRIESLRGK
jgi:hypothetical protein